MSNDTVLRGLLDIYRVPRRSRKNEHYARELELAAEIVTVDPKRIASLASACISESLHVFPGLDSLLAYMPMDAWPQLVAEAVVAIAEDSDDETSVEIIERATLQAPQAVHPFLKRLFATLEPLSTTLIHAFREARLQDVEFLLDYSKTNAADPGTAYYCLRETRLPEALQYLREQDESFLYHLSEIGFEAADEGFRQLYPEAVYHIAFASGYTGPATYLELHFDYPSALEHPTWARSASDVANCRFGGAADVTCGVCGKEAHHLITLDSIPEGLGVTQLARLEIITCLSCLGWERESLSYQHSAAGKAQDLNHTADYIRPEFEAEPLSETRVALVNPGPRWHWQEWGVSNGRENLHRVGGHPSWVQDAEYPACPQCSKTSSFLLQLDSDLPTSNQAERSPQRTGWLWGSGGLCYVFWCDNCNVSTLFWQCT